MVSVGGAPTAMQLDLDPYNSLSGWCSILNAYERWVLADNKQIRRDFSEQLMSVLPVGLTTRLQPSAPLFATLLDLVDPEVKRVDELLAQGRTANRKRLLTLREFWAETFRDALDLPFRGVEDAHQDNLRNLYEMAPR
jgi:hypothetical protein